MEREYTEQELIRREKVNKLKELGLDPFGQRFDRTAYSKEIKDLYQDDVNTVKAIKAKYQEGLDKRDPEISNKFKEEIEPVKEKYETNDEKYFVKVAGRIMTNRRQGKAGFMNIQDKCGNIQIYLRSDNVGEENYELYKMSDIGDIVGIDGYVFITNTGELSIKAIKYTHLTKALKPLPEKFHGLTDKEERYRRRYVDLIMNEDSKNVAFLRPRIIRCIQSYLDNQGYTEVETPILTNLLTGASARQFVTHHNAQDIDMYLRIALELNLKRLLVGGMEKVYEIGRTFRNEGMDLTHNPEFTLMELYCAYSDLSGMMDLTEGMFKEIANKVCGKTTFKYRGYDISVDGTWKRVSMVDSVKEITGIDFKDPSMTLDKALALANEHHIEVAENEKNLGHIINLFFEAYV